MAWLLWQQEGLFLPLLTACALHEGGHLLSALALGISVKGISLTAFGAQLNMDRRCPGWQEALVLGAGPGVNLLCAGVLLSLPVGPVWGAVHLLLAGLNLLPIPPLDGGELSRLFWEGLLKGRSGWVIWHLLAKGCCALVLASGAALAAAGNPAMLALGLWLLLGNGELS